MTITNDESNGGVDDRQLDHPHSNSSPGSTEAEASDATSDLEPSGGVALEGGAELMRVSNTSEGSEEGVGSAVLDEDGEEDADGDTPFGLVVMAEGEAEDHDGDYPAAEAIGAAIFDS